MNHRTPAQIAGLIHSPKTEHEQMLEEMANTVRGPDGLTFTERKAGEKLERRRKLLAEATALAEENARAAEEIERKRTKLMERLARAEQEWRAAQEAARGLPLWAPTSPRIGEIHRELIESCDPRLRDLLDWLAREISVNRAHAVPFITLDVPPTFENPKGHVHGYNGYVKQALEDRLGAINTAMTSTRALMLEALTDVEISDRIEQILAMVPPIPAGASQVAPTPMPLTIDGRLPAPHVQERETKIAAIGEQYKLAAKSDRRTRR